jgi:hypothetical protein
MSEQELIEAARAYALQRGWTWREPVQATAVTWKGVEACQIDTHVGYLGMNVLVVVSVADGTILHSAYMPR